MKSFRTFLEEAKKERFLSNAYHESLDVQPNKEFRYLRNTDSAKHYTKHLQGDPYGQKLEPAGRYMQATTMEHKDLPKKMEHGTHSFKNPLYIHWGSGSYKDPDNWKNVLHSHYGKKNKSLSQAIRDDGYDGVVTVGHHGDRPHTSEIVDLSMFKGRE